MENYNQGFMGKMISFEESQKLDINTVRDYYRQYVNPGIEDIIYSFSFGEDIVESAQGVWMSFRNRKNKVFDATGGMGVLNLGHNHPRILAARIGFQQSHRMEVHKIVFSQYTAALSHNLAMLFDGKLQYSFFCNSGAEAVESAIKTAYKYHEGNRKSILHADISYHGKLLGAGSVTGSKELGFKFPLIPGVHSFDFNSIQSVKDKLSELKTADKLCDVYAIIIEPFSVSTLTGCDEGFLKELKELCFQNDIVLIFDEVFSGWYKTGPLFYCFKSGVLPDILVVSKALGGGKSSISASISNAKVFTKAFGNTQNAFLHSTTYNGFGEECATAIEAVNTMIEEDLAGKTVVVEAKVKAAFDNLRKKHSHKFVKYWGAGSLFGFHIKVVPSTLGKLLEVLPVDYARERFFVEKLEASAFCDYLFREFDIYTVFGGQLEIHVLFGPAPVVSETELDAALQKIDLAVAGFSFSHVIEFAVRKFTKKVF